MVKSWHFGINSYLHYCGCCRHHFTNLNSNTKLYSKLDQRCSYYMGHSGSDEEIQDKIQKLKTAIQWVRDQLIDLQKQVILKCDWNSTQFCITPVRFNYSAYNWEQIKFHLQDIHDNTSLIVQLLQKKIFETFSKICPLPIIQKL